MFAMPKLDNASRVHRLSSATSIAYRTIRGFKPSRTAFEPKCERNTSAVLASIRTCGTFSCT